MIGYVVIGIIILMIIMMYIQRKRFIKLLGYTEWLIDKKRETEYIPDKKVEKIEGKNFIVHRDGEGVGFSMNGWLKIIDFSYRYGTKKYLFRKMTDDKKGIDMMIYLHETENTLMIELNTYDGIVEIDVPRVEIQKWVHIAVNVFQNVVDVWMNNKLVRSKKLINLPKFSEDRHMVILGEPGFKGLMSRWRYDGYVLDRELIKRYSEKDPESFSFLDRMT